MDQARCGVRAGRETETAGTPEEQEELGRLTWAAPSPRRSTERHNRLEQRGAVAFGKRGAAVAVMLRRAVGLYVLADVTAVTRALDRMEVFACIVCRSSSR